MTRAPSRKRIRGQEAVQRTLGNGQWARNRQLEVLSGDGNPNRDRLEVYIDIDQRVLATIKSRRWAVIFSSTADFEAHYALSHKTREAENAKGPLFEAIARRPNSTKKKIGKAGESCRNVGWLGRRSGPSSANLALRYGIRNVRF